MQSRIYLLGYADGLAWDLDGYASIREVESDPHTWDSALIEAAGSDEVAAAWGVDPNDDAAWSAACAEYNAGARAGALAPQDERTGAPPRDGGKGVL